MKKRIFAISLMLIALSILTLSCKKDKNSASNEPETPTNYEEPENVVTINLLNDEGSYVHILGCYMKISSANNFYKINFNDHNISFVDVGAVESLGYVYQIPQSGWSDQVAVFPGDGYILKDDCYDNYGLVYTRFARVFVVDYIYNANNEIIGAQLQYQDDWYYKMKVRTHGVTGITSTQAVFGGSIVYADNSITEKGFCWSSTTMFPSIDDNTIIADDIDEDSFTKEVHGFEPATLYFVTAYIVRSRFGVIYGESYQFKTLESPGYATVITNSVMNITETSATCYGFVEKDGDYAVVERGVCWGTTGNPTIESTHMASGSGLGVFSVEMTDLTPNATYYVRAYAINEFGTAYGKELSFVAAVPYVPEGAIGGLFSVSETKQVYFSQGNLQYKATANTWQFAENQYDYIGFDNDNISPDYDGWIDLFGWGTGDNPTDTSPFYMYTSDFTDWGTNAISNGGNTTNSWRTLKDMEWDFVLNTRATASGIRFAKAQINDINGLILLPDNWSSGVYDLNETNNVNANFNCNVINPYDLINILGANGAVFLPMAGYREEHLTQSVNDAGYYWSETYHSIYSSRGLRIDNNNVIILFYYSSTGFSVRLVTDAVR